MIFSVRNGSFGYHTKDILKHVSFSLQEGEVLCILGPNGVGKTTLLKCTMGFLPWREGATYLDDRPLSSYPDRQLWQHIAYVPQARGNAFPLSALDMVMLGRSSHLGVFAQPKEEDRSIALRAMEEADILSLKDKRCDEMSGGELQMVLIARALAVQPRMLVFDEPESNLDFRNQLVILNTIRDLAESKHLSIIVNTHYPEHALRIADHALLLNKDGTNLYGKVCEVVNELNLRKTFMVQVHINDFVYQEKHYQNVVPLSLL